MMQSFFSLVFLGKAFSVLFAIQQILIYQKVALGVKNRPKTLSISHYSKKCIYFIFSWVLKDDAFNSIFYTVRNAQVLLHFFVF